MRALQIERFARKPEGGGRHSFKGDLENLPIF